MLLYNCAGYRSARDRHRSARVQHCARFYAFTLLIHGVIISATAGERIENIYPKPGCPPGSKTLYTPKSTYCTCDVQCSGSQCKTALHKGVRIYGFATECSDCTCASEGTHTSSPSSSMRDEPKKLKIIFIKAYKVASTTAASIISRMGDEQGLKAASRYNSGVPLKPSLKGQYQLVYGHNFYSMGSKSGFPCTVKIVDKEWTYCGGYQSWMDYYVEDAVHLIMVAEPTHRVASMYYYEAGYTKQRDRAPADSEYGRINNAERFLDPQNADQSYIAHFIHEEFGSKWERVQWWWVRDSTVNKTLNESINVLRHTFTIGISHRMDETLLMWKKKLRLYTRDILYTSMKSSLPHPSFDSWTAANRAAVRRLTEMNGDIQYYQAALSIFVVQIKDYGEKDLNQDLERFRSLLTILRRMCGDYVIDNEQLHVPEQVYCMLRAYDRVYESKYATTTDMGCYNSLQTPSGRLRQLGLSNAMTITKCRMKCLKGMDKHSFQVFALAYGTHCYCGDDVPPDTTKVDDAWCAAPCTGSKLTVCGGTEAYSVHVIKDHNETWSDPILSGQDVEMYYRTSGAVVLV